MKLVLVGGGGHCRSCIETIRSAGLEIGGVIDRKAVSQIFGFARLGGDEWLDSQDAHRFAYLVTVGQVGVVDLRRDLFNALEMRQLEIATVVSPHAVVAGDATVGKGGIVLHRAVVNAGAEIGVNCIINTGAIIEHDVRIADHCHISTGATVNGGARIGSGCLIGSGAVVLQGVNVTDKVLVGAGAVVVEDIDEPGTWVGVPARRRA
jgi:sugar O-acyltransferase (sialic acid O-acetyltransferase NeuD family)